MKNKNLGIGIAVVAVVAIVGTFALRAGNLLALASGKQPIAPPPVSSNQGKSSQTIDYSQITNLSTAAQTATMKGDVQEIATELEAYGYPALTVQKGVPVKWVISADAANLNGCNNEIIIPSLGISQELKAGKNVIEFTPAESGILQYSCWMGMINSTIAVVDDINNYDAAEVQRQIDTLPPAGGCCGARW